MAVVRWTVTLPPEFGDGAAEEPLKVLALQLPRGEGRPGQGLQLPAEGQRKIRDVRDGPVQHTSGPLGEARAVDGGAAAGHGGVGEHGDVRGCGVEHQAGVLVVTPDPAGAGS